MQSSAAPLFSLSIQQFASLARRLQLCAEQHQEANTCPTSSRWFQPPSHLLAAAPFSAGVVAVLGIACFPLLKRNEVIRERGAWPLVAVLEDTGLRRGWDGALTF